MKLFKIILALFLFSQIISAQEMRVTGIVKDSTGLPLPGVNVLVRSTHDSVQTDIDGNYSIKAKYYDTLVFSFTGRQTQNVIVGYPKINVKLADINFKLKNIENSPILRIKRPKSATSTITTKELIRTTTPKQYFNGNAKNDIFIIFVSSLSTLEKKDLDFQKNYSITYLPFNTDYTIYFKRYNIHTL